MIYKKPDLKDFQPLPLDLQGWNSESVVFKNMVAETRPEVILEIGTWKGASAVNMAETCKKLGLKTEIFCVDTWLGSHEFRVNREMYGTNWDLMEKFGYPQVYFQFLSNIVHMGVADIITPVPALSRDAAKILPAAELIYIDASHDYLSVKEDLEAYWMKLKKGGIMFGDDYTLTGHREEDGYIVGVRRAVDEFAALIGKEIEILENNFWVIRK